jgi:hypothetical protein
MVFVGIVQFPLITQERIVRMAIFMIRRKSGSAIKQPVSWKIASIALPPLSFVVEDGRGFYRIICPLIFTYTAGAVCRSSPYCETSFVCTRNLSLDTLKVAIRINKKWIGISYFIWCIQPANEWFDLFLCEPGFRWQLLRGASSSDSR